MDLFSRITRYNGFRGTISSKSGCASTATIERLMSHSIFFERGYAYFTNPDDFPVPFRMPISFFEAKIIGEAETANMYIALVRMEDETIETIVAVKNRNRLTHAGLLPFAYSKEQKRLHVVTDDDKIIVIRSAEGTYTLKYNDKNIVYTLDSLIRLIHSRDEMKPSFWRFNPWALQTGDQKNAGFYAGITRDGQQLVAGFKSLSEGEWKMRFSKGFVSPLLFEPKADGTIQSVHIPLTLIPTEARTVETVDEQGLTSTEYRSFVMVNGEGIVPVIPLY